MSAIARPGLKLQHLPELPTTSLALIGLLLVLVSALDAEASPANTRPKLPAMLANSGDHIDHWRPGVVHNHSTDSDGLNSWPMMLNGYRLLPGIKWAAMTDHYPPRFVFGWMDENEYGKQYEAIRDHWQSPAFSGVPGMEISPGMPFFEHPHVLGLFKAWYVPKNVKPTQIAAVIREIHEHNGFPIIAHPYDRLAGNPALQAKILEEVLKPAQGERMRFGVEIINERPKAENRASIAIWLKFLLQGARALPAFGRDAHSLSVPDSSNETAISDEGAIVVYTKNNTMTDIVNALRAGRFYASTGAGIAIWARPRLAPPLIFEAPEDYHWMGDSIRTPQNQEWEIEVSFNTRVARRLEVKLGLIGEGESTLLTQEVTGSMSRTVRLVARGNFYVRAQLVAPQGCDTAATSNNEAFSSPIWFSEAAPVF